MSTKKLKFFKGFDLAAESEIQAVKMDFKTTGCGESRKRLQGMFLQKQNPEISGLCKNFLFGGNVWLCLDNWINLTLVFLVIWIWSF